MLLFGLGWVATSLVHATTEAPITAVTVYSDRARVVRTATLGVSGTQRVELPRLPLLVDPESIRVEAQGAEVSSVDVRPASAPPFPQKEARKLLDTLDRLDDSIARVEAERAAHEAQLAALRRVQPVMPRNDDDSPSTPVDFGPLAPATWGPSATFLVDNIAKLESRIRALTEQASALGAERTERLAEAGNLGAQPRRPGIEVAVTLAGNGPAKVQLSYLVPQRVRWYPRYELQLQPEQRRVQVALSGRVSQDTGEDWEGAKLTLSTALPSNATALPKLATWKIGTSERFIPEPQAREESASPPPPLPPRAPEPDLEQELRGQLLARAGRSAEAPAPVASRPPAPSRSQAASPNPSSTILGTVIDAASRQPVPDVVVTATTPNLQGEQVVVTDAVGNYRIPQLPSGVYTLRFEKEMFKPYARSDVQLRSNRTIRVNVELLPESLGEVVEITGRPPTINVGSTTAGVSVSEELVRSISTHSNPSEPVIDSFVGLAPPPGWQPPQLEANLPASLAGGYDLAFTAPRLETVRSGQGERTIPLLVESWPVQVERQVFPALAPDAYLVAQLKSPSRGVLPGGEASLFVGADPAGTATLDLVVPGEPFTLPLGVDRSVRPARNVRLVQSQEGLISKDDVNTYEVTLEVPNPYAFPLQVRVVDQWPLNQDGKVEVKWVRTTPAAQSDEKTGELRWDLVVPPSSKKTVSFEYSLRRPKDWRLLQSP
ncbi:mucoidy inhibitor MuiA family protein [Pyxidicoccus fallax]|uniref:Mucoidy inhibitor MuiA family protein n=1 Tax=Pyxidicoccus fallax TaxID=394095 RepID=A0A848L6G3_9BACT|nr:mucoidy inhibitor MuiA family protein [Pyxidicoccus fallax]NMO14550.1 mucoidy inhibitor MuiA family protein [Pyxidicoccus fallax]NPC77069.1 mucoidy inhibitor MuiA family protein [Pyxidicoccus fallax]